MKSASEAVVVCSGLAHLCVPCKGGNDEVAGHGRIGVQAALVPTFAKPAKVGQPPAFTCEFCFAGAWFVAKRFFFLTSLWNSDIFRAKFEGDNLIVLRANS
jgi:hypothetical protein